MKRLRSRYHKKKIRYYHCGEYGDKFKRPHYHACLFDFNFPDLILFKETNGQKLYTSEILDDIWQKGYATVGTVTFDSAAYVARYILKKVTGEKSQNHYHSLDKETGELQQIIPEYTTMSLKPGIAHGWFEQFSSDVYPSDYIILNGKKLKPPRYYDTLYEITNKTQIDLVKSKRRTKLNKKAKENTSERLHTKETVKLKQLSHLIRPYED